MAGQPLSRFTPRSKDRLLLELQEEAFFQVESAERRKRPHPVGQETLEASSRTNLRHWSSQTQGGHVPSSLLLQSYVPDSLVQAYHDCGLLGGQLYPWQAEALSTPGVLQGRNFVYGAPTAGGKSLVAEILLLRRVLCTGRPALLVLPYVSLCAEKAVHLRHLLKDSDRKVEEFYGVGQPLPSLSEPTAVIICTIEKANMLINRLISSHCVNVLSTVVVDELHMVGDEDRGYQLELLLTKLRFALSNDDDHVENWESCSQSVSQPTFDAFESSFWDDGGLQLIGMSATLPNLVPLACWLEAAHYQTDWRPVCLNQYVVDKTGAILDIHGKFVRNLPRVFPASKDQDGMLSLVQEAASLGAPVLVFCATKRACELMAVTIAASLSQEDLPQETESIFGQHRTGFQNNSLLQRNAQLALLVSKRVAFHHSGLSSEERAMVEAAFRSGKVLVLVATSTVAAGVNLPVQRVIFKHIHVGQHRNKQYLDPTKYRQMAGRAGRTISSDPMACGESFLLASDDAPVSKLLELTSAPVEPTQSCLREDKRGMKRAMLEAVCLGLVLEPHDVRLYVKSTLLAQLTDKDVVTSATLAALSWLGQASHPFIAWDKDLGVYRPLALGQAALASGFGPEECLQIHKDLLVARDGMVLLTDLHLAYLCVSPSEELAIRQPDWHSIMRLLARFPGPECKVAERLGLTLASLNSASLGASKVNGETSRNAQRLWLAALISQVLTEGDVADVSARHGLQEAQVQGLMDRSARTAGMLAVFCERLGWHDLESLLSRMQVHILHGVVPEAHELTQLPFVKMYTARLLCAAGFRTIEAIAELADEAELVRILSKPKGGIDQRDEAVEQARVRRAARAILEAARARSK